MGGVREGAITQHGTEGSECNTTKEYITNKAKDTIVQMKH